VTVSLLVIVVCSRCEIQPHADALVAEASRAQPAELWWRLVRSETLARLLRELVEGCDYDGERCAQWSTTRSTRVLGGVFTTDDLLALAGSATSAWFGVALSLPVRSEDGPCPERIAAYNTELAAAVRDRRLRVVRPAQLTVPTDGDAATKRQATLRAALARSVNAVALAVERGGAVALGEPAGPGTAIVVRDEPTVMAERALARGAAHWLIDERRARGEEDAPAPRRHAA
jgi:hypothetical protein